MVDSGADWKLVEFVCKDERMLDTLLDFLCRAEPGTVDDIATALAYLASACGQGRLLCAATVRNGFRHYPRENLLRGTSFHVGVLSEYARCWGGSYLRSVLAKPVASLLKAKTDIEIEARKTSGAEELKKNLNCFVTHVDKIIGNITNTKIPPQIKEILQLLHQSSKDCSTKPMSPFLIISTLLFLRVICPALVSPELYGLAKVKQIGSRERRKLVLIAKVIQNIANEIDPFEEEDHMLVLSDCIKDSISTVQEWTHSIFGSKLGKVDGKKQAKYEKLLPYRQRLTSYLQKNEDPISQLFRERMNDPSVREAEEERDYLQLCLYRFNDALDERRKEIGADPTMARSFDKVWERVERRTSRMNRLDAPPGSGSYPAVLASSSGSWQCASPDEAAGARSRSNSVHVSSEITKTFTDDGTNTSDDASDDESDVFSYTDDSAISKPSSSSSSSSVSPKHTPTKPRRSSISTASPRTSPSGSPTVGLRRMSMAERPQGFASGSPPNPYAGHKLVFKCYHAGSTKPKFLPMPTSAKLSYAEFVLLLYRKLQIDTSKSLRLTYVPASAATCDSAVSSVATSTTTTKTASRISIVDDASFGTFIGQTGVIKDYTTTPTVTFSLYVD